MAWRNGIYRDGDLVSGEHAVESPQRSAGVIRRRHNQQTPKLMCARIGACGNSFVICALYSRREFYEVGRRDASSEQEVTTSLDRSRVPFSLPRPSPNKAVVGKDDRACATLMEKRGGMLEPFLVHGGPG